MPLRLLCADRGCRIHRRPANHPRQPVLTTSTLHNAARWYCEERWRELQDAGLVTGDATFFIRRDAVEEIRIEIERFTPADFTGPAEAREFLAAAGETARGLVIRRRNLTGAEQLGIVEERRRYIHFIQRLDERAAAAAPALRYRRTLAFAEKDALWSRLREAWHITDPWAWYPLHPGRLPDGAFVFQCDPFDDQRALGLLRTILRSRGIERVFEIREAPPHCEIDVADFEPAYNMLEGYWTSPACDWIAYASHESSVTLGGWVLEELKRAWPEWALWEYVFPTD